MMVLYHLHNPAAPAFVTTCNICHLDIETGQGWRCEVCSDFDVCNACYHKDDNSQHRHKLTNHPSMADRDAQNMEERQIRVQQLCKMLDLLVHTSHCRSAQCLYHTCRKGAFPSWDTVQNTCIWRLCPLQENMVSCPTPRSSLQRIQVPLSTLQRSKRTFEEGAAAV